MSDSIKLELLTPSKQVGCFDVSSVLLPGVKGYIGVGLNHTPFMSMLGVGALSFDLVDGSSSQPYYISGGVLKVESNRVCVLVETIEQASSIDSARAQQACDRADTHLGAIKPSTDVNRALFALKRAQSRLTLANLKQEKT